MPRTSLPQAAIPPGRVCGKCLDAARDKITIFRKDSATESGLVADSVGAAVPSWTRSWNTRSNVEATRGQYACVHDVVCCIKLADGGITSEPGGLSASQSRPADMFTSAAVPGRSAALDVCVASSIAAAARGFDRKLSHCRNEIGELRQQGIQYRPLVWTADGRPHPAVSRTLQGAADVASSRNE